MKQKQSLALAAVLFMAAAATRAQVPGDHHWYAGLDVGQSNFDKGSGYSNVDDSSTAYALRFGYRFSPHFALEGGYTDIGDFSAELRPICPNDPPGACPVIYETTAIDGFLLNAVGIWPVTHHFELTASLGGILRTRATSFTAARAFMVPKVMIWPTLSRP